ncbi:unnamed protein product [Chrysoparadoxa australica]
MRRRQQAPIGAAMLVARLAAEAFRIGAGPVTLGLLGVNVLMYIQPGLVADLLWNSPLPKLPTLMAALHHDQVQGVCLNPAAMMAEAESGLWSSLAVRLIASGLIHGSDMHLYYNMSSLLLKGSSLETSMGSLVFLSMTGQLLVMEGLLYIALAYAATFGPLADLLRSLGVTWLADSYYSCAVGFSGVLFGYKYLLQRRSNEPSTVMGIVLPLKYVTWAELVLIQLVAPNASFLGHLCGILAAILWEGSFLRSLSGLIKFPALGTAGSSSRSHPSYQYNSGASGWAGRSDGRVRPHQRNTADYSEDAAVKAAIERSLREQ